MGAYTAALTFFSKTAAIHDDDLGGGVHLYYLQAETADGTVVLSVVGNAFSLDGGPLISFNDLPAGFTPTSCNVRAPSNIPTSTIGVARIRAGSATDVARATLQFGIYGPTITNGDTSVNGLPLDIPVIPSTLDPTDLIALFNAVFHTVYDGIGSTNPLVDILAPLELYGSYTLVAFPFDIDPPSGSSVEVGQLITITSTGLPGSLQLDQLTLSVTCGIITPIVQTATLLTFLVPDSCSGAGPTTLSATGNGVQFSGTVPLGTLDILLTNASGIYTLVPGKTNDTLYSSLRDGTTRDVKIPNPFAKTGFIGG